MNIESWLTMFLVLSTVWGGLFYFMMRALKYEKEKTKIGE